MNKYIYRLAPLLLLIFIDSFSYFLVLPVLLKLFYHDQYGLLAPSVTLATRNLLTGFTVSLSTCAALIAAPFIGNASDHYGRKKTLLICIVGVAIGFLLPIFGIIRKNIYLILAGRLIAGIGSASQPVAQAAVADLCEGKTKSFYFSLIAIMLTLPMIFGALVGGYLSDNQLVSWFNVTIPYASAFILAVISFLLVLIFFEETKHAQLREQVLSMIDVIAKFKRAIAQYHLGFFILIFLCLEIGWSGYYQAIFLYLNQQFHYTVTQVSLFNAFLGAVMCGSLLFIYPMLLRIFSLLKILRYSILITALCLWCCAAFTVPSCQWIFAALAAVAVNCGYVSLVTLVSNAVPEDRQGWMMGYLSTVLYLAWMITALFDGWLITIHAALPLYLAASFVLLAAMANFACQNSRVD